MAYDRITDAHLKCVVLELNKLTNSPTEYMSTVDGKRVFNGNHYLIDSAYGGNKLARTCSDGIGQRDITTGGFVTKRELYNQIRSIINVLQGAK